MLEKLNNQEKLISYKKLYLEGSNKVEYDFTNFSWMRNLFKEIYYGREMIVNAFKNKIFPLKDPSRFLEYVSEEDMTSRSGLDSSRSSSPINNEDIDPKIIGHYFGFNSLNEIYSFLNKGSADKDLNEAIINPALIGLKLHIRELPKKEKQTTQLKLLANSVDRIFNDAINKQQGQGLKILTPQQVITRLPILLAQLKAESNSEKLKIEIRQFLHSLHRSTNLSKTIYNSLMNTI